MKRRPFLMFSALTSPMIASAKPISLAVGGKDALPGHVSDIQISQSNQSSSPLAKPVTSVSEANQLRTDLSSEMRDRGASLITVNDAARNFPELAGRHVEAALSALAGRIHGVSLLKFGKPESATDALNAAVSTYSAGADIKINSGNWQLKSGWIFRGQRIHICGAGKNITNIELSANMPVAALNFDNQTKFGIGNSSVSRLSFISTDLVAKTAIRLSNVANFEISNISIIADNWRGDSIGIQALGRQLLDISNCDIKCARPLLFSPNTIHPTLATDHFIVRYSEFVGTSSVRPVIEFEDGVNFSNVTLHNIACVGGSDGIRWLDNLSRAASFKLHISNFRSEQGLDVDGWSINLESHSQFLQSLLIENALLDRSRQGIRLRNVQRATFIGVDFNQVSGKVSLDMNFVSGSRLTMINCWRQVGSIQELKNAKCVSRESSPGGGFTEEWVYDSGFSTSATASDVYQGGTHFVLASGTKIEICDNRFIGFLMIATDSAGNGLISISNLAPKISIVNDTRNAFAAIQSKSGSISVYYSNNRLILDNQTNNQITGTIVRMGCATGA